MDDSLNFTRELPAEQKAIRDRCCHPNGKFVEFKKEEIEQSIPERFEKIARMYPDQIAVKTRTHALTYDELNRDANRVGRAILNSREKSKEEQVLLLLENDAPMIAAMLGVLKAGQIYIPLDPASHESKASFVVENSRAPILLTNTRNLHRAKALAQQIRQVINIDQVDASLPADNMGVSISPSALAYVLYTSGSTGKPKGVMQNHRNIQYKTMAYTNDFHFCADDRIALFCPLTFALSVGFIFGALLNGACLYVKDLREEGLGCFEAWLIEERITVYNSVPTVFRNFMGTLTPKAQFPDLRLVHLGGEQVTKRDVELYKKHFSRNCILINNLGSAETGTIAQYFIDKATLISGSVVPAGYATQDTEIQVLDDNNRKIGPNQVGTIALKSRYLALGYWGESEFTSDSLLRPAQIQEDRIHYTGDLGLIRPDGCLEHVGRKDFQIKISGQRVEPGEIEVALLDVETVKHAVVVARDNHLDGLSAPRGRDKHLVAYIVPVEKSLPSVTALRSALLKKLPAYAIPSRFVLLDALPLTSRGKVDRRALPAPDTSRPKLDNLFVQPRRKLESQLAKIWEQILGVYPIGVKDGFFDLGGTSLLAVRVVQEIEKTFRKALPLAALYQAPTIEQLADVLQKKQRSAPCSVLLPIQPVGSKPPFFWVYGSASDLFLPRYLGPEQPLYGLKNQTHDGTRAVFNRIEDIAADHLRELRAVQPEGPYFLGGFCFGGIVAFEMARQLQQQQKKVALLVLVDLGVLRNCSFKVDHGWSFGKFLGYSRDVATIAAHGKLRSAGARVQDGLGWRLKHRIQEAKSIGEWICRIAYFVIGRPLPPPLRESYIRVVDKRALKRYEPTTYGGRLVLFKAQESSYDPRLITRFVTGGLEIHEVPCKHREMIQESHIGLWAEILKSQLTEAQANM